MKSFKNTVPNQSRRYLFKSRGAFNNRLSISLPVPPKPEDALAPPSTAAISSATNESFSKNLVRLTKTQS